MKNRLNTADIIFLARALECCNQIGHYTNNLTRIYAGTRKQKKLIEEIEQRAHILACEIWDQIRSAEK